MRRDAPDVLHRYPTSTIAVERAVIKLDALIIARRGQRAEITHSLPFTEKLREAKASLER
jgi:hypothetical protein